MKKTIKYLSLLTLVVAFSCNKNEKIPNHISGTVKGLKSGTIYLEKFYNKMFLTIDSAKIENGSFHFSSTIDIPELYGLSVDTNQYPLFLFLENHNPVEVEFDTTDYDKSKITGSAASDLFKQYRSIDGEIKIDSFIRKNPKSIVSAYILYRDFSYRLTPQEIEANLALLDTSLNHLQYIKVLNELVTTLKKVEIGKKAIDFALPDTTGKEVKLSEYYGKYLLLDFWASWCPPCRKENPNLVKAYEKYKNKGFDIFSVSLDKKRDSWIKAINDDKLTWHHVSDLTYWNSAAAKTYGIRAIPSNVLIGPDGTIVAKNLRGDDLEKKLNEIFSNK